MMSVRQVFDYTLNTGRDLFDDIAMAEYYRSLLIRGDDRHQYDMFDLICDVLDGLALQGLEWEWGDVLANTSPRINGKAFRQYLRTPTELHTEEPTEEMPEEPTEETAELTAEEKYGEGGDFTNDAYLVIDKPTPKRLAVETLINLTMSDALNVEHLMDAPFDTAFLIFNEAVHRKNQAREKAMRKR